MEDRDRWIRMAAVKGIDGYRAQRYLSCPAGPVRQMNDNWLRAGLTARQRQSYLRDGDSAVRKAHHWLNNPRHHLLTFADTGYPESLRHINCPPAALFVAGEPSLLGERQIAMVGSRQNSLYGEQWGAAFAARLAVAGVTITSGLALGIDGICHRAALSENGKTLAVLGSGLGNVYPRQHRHLARSIIEKKGALVSEFVPDAPPLARHFPWRNRLISALSQGVLVVEATINSGSLVTARCALEQGKDVFALPGPLGNPMTAGTHWLIQQGAYLITCPEEMLDQLYKGLNWLTLTPEKIISTPECEVELPFAKVLANVGDEVTPVDVVAERAGQPVPEVVAILLELELAGWIAVVPGGYVRLRRASHVRRTNIPV
ncbi:DNA-protecting protein DprA [Biostraticola tofi]|uniref:DNA processing protein n=1 Tax=Biostraticola tofi TaxID=466109 RepID=A0A4R3YK20_9GAMM|nr:DNA-protecting protein DprA [Biostraticola tofi]TCV91364.1 DNA processing protein [Biostraticola tofi]